MPVSRILCLVVAAVLPLAAQSSSASPQEFKWVSATAGSTFFGDSLLKTQLNYGLSGGWWFTDRWGVEVRGTRGNVVNSSGTLLAHQSIGTVSALWRVWPGEFQWQPYLALGMGSTRNLAYGITAEGLYHRLEIRPAFNAGAGVYRRFGDRGLLSFDYRAVHTGMRGTQFNDHLVSVGVGVTFGEPKPPATPEPAPPRVTPPPAPPPAPMPAPVEAAPAPAPPKAVPAAPAPRRKARLKGAIVRFANGQAVLDDKGTVALNQVALSLKEHGGSFEVKVTGHASKIGPKAFNQRLSLKRAQVAADHLVAAGVSVAAIVVEARGTADPQADNRTRKGRSMNRRAVVAVKGDPDVVEIQILDTDPVTKKIVKKASKKHASKAPVKKSRKRGKK